MVQVTIVVEVAFVWWRLVYPSFGIDHSVVHTFSHFGGVMASNIQCQLLYGSFSDLINVLLKVHHGMLLRCQKLHLVIHIS